MPLKIFQTMACLEVLHSMIGLVKSPWFTTFMQGKFETDTICYLLLFFTLVTITILFSNASPSPLTVTVFSRVWTLWAVMDIAPPAQTSIFFALACTSWALVEVPR